MAHTNRKCLTFLVLTGMRQISSSKPLGKWLVGKVHFARNTYIHIGKMTANIYVHDEVLHIFLWRPLSYSVWTSFASSNRRHLVGIIIPGYILFSTKGTIRVKFGLLWKLWCIDCIYAGYISEVVVHSKKYNHHETKFTHYMFRLLSPYDFLFANSTPLILLLEENCWAQHF